MIHTLIGPEAYRKGMDLYFQRHDGQAVTCEDFVAVHGRRVRAATLTHFMRWYAPGRHAGRQRSPREL